MTDNAFAQTRFSIIPPYGTAGKIVLCHGCFDLLHLGHIKHLQEAKAMGDWLVVSVTADPHVAKGIGRPHFTAKQRVEALLALECVDDAFVNESGDAVDAISRIKPAVYVKGIDYAGKENEDQALKREIEAVEVNGGKFAVTKSDKWSSTKILNLETIPEKTLAYLDSARAKGFLPKIKRAFEAADSLSIAFVGETIVDEYRYVRAIGKPSKENCLAVVSLDDERFDGGVIAASLHGEWDNPQVITAQQSIHKTRYVDADFSRKLFEVYQPQVINLLDSERNTFTHKLSSAVDSADAVIVFDFGHGLIDEMALSILHGSSFIAVNTQSNAGNHGFNTLNKYRNCDLACIDEPEARLATENQFGSEDEVVRRLGRSHANVIVTHGNRQTITHGSCGLNKIPTFSTPRVDTMGAGDAFLAVAAPLVAAGLELEAAAFVGNVVGAIKCSILGHRRPVRRQEIMQTVEALLS